MLPLVLTPRDLAQLRISRTVAERAAATGRWQRAASGVYLPHDRPATPRELVAAADAHVQAPHAITGLLVLYELGLPWLPPLQAVQVLVPPDVRRRSGRLVHVRRAQHFAELTTWTRYGSRLVETEQAVVDASRARDLRTARGLVLGAVAAGRADVDELRRVLDAGASGGSATTRRALLDAHRGCASPPEAELVDALIGRRVPFYVNPELWLDAVLLGCPDVWLVGRGVGGEVESQERHGSAGQVESTYDRHERFGGHGLELVHLSVRRIRVSATEAASRLLAEPPRAQPAGLRVVPRGPLLS
ncbi:MAG: hypothetical protein LC789_07615 [Actinobacteria bacterium]|nr:hypothetical protein [Actinomycetota bacterium]MCA1720468.1 hypothetical protein [Actinomycetota bacterium]